MSVLRAGGQPVLRPLREARMPSVRARVFARRTLLRELIQTG